jgi:hypothetical protein
MKIKHKDAWGNYPWFLPTNPNPNTSESKEQAAHRKPTKIARKRHENPTSYKRRIDATMKASIHSEVRFLTNGGKSNPLEQGNEESGWMVCLETLELIYMSPFRARQMTTLLLALKLWYNPLGANRSCSSHLHRTATPSPQTVSSWCKHSDPATRPPALKLLGAPGSHLHPSSLWSWFCGSTKYPDGFVVNRRKPRVQTLVVCRYPAPAPVDDFVLLFLPPCGPHLTPLATGSLESGLLVSPLLRGPVRHRPFAATLHQHQCKSSRNLLLQNSAKSQSTPRCQSLITARSDHPPVLGRSGPQSPPWWVHWQHTQVTNSKKIKKKRN